MAMKVNEPVQKVTLICTGRRKSDPSKPCGHILAKEFSGTISIKCPKCDTVMEFR